MKTKTSTIYRNQGVTKLSCLPIQFYHCHELIEHDICNIQGTIVHIFFK